MQVEMQVEMETEVDMEVQVQVDVEVEMEMEVEVEMEMEGGVRVVGWGARRRGRARIVGAEQPERAEGQRVRRVVQGGREPVEAQVADEHLGFLLGEALEEHRLGRAALRVSVRVRERVRARVRVRGRVRAGVRVRVRVRGEG